MFPPTSSTQAPLPPLPDMNKSGGGQAGQPDNPMAQVMAGVAPVKSAVDAIMQACKMIVSSGAIPGSEQVCSQIMALSTSLLPMAVQQAMMPQGPPSGTIGGLGA